MEAAVSLPPSEIHIILLITVTYREEEDPDEYPFPLTLRSKKSTGPTSPAEDVITNGSS